MTSRLDPQSLAYRKPTPRDMARIHEADRAAVLAPVHRAASVDNCWRCDGTGAVTQWPMHSLSALEIATGSHRQTTECELCEGTGRIYEDEP